MIPDFETSITVRSSLAVPLHLAIFVHQLMPHWESFLSPKANPPSERFSLVPYLEWKVSSVNSYTNFPVDSDFQVLLRRRDYPDPYSQVKMLPSGDKDIAAQELKLLYVRLSVEISQRSPWRT